MGFAELCIRTDLGVRTQHRRPWQPSLGKARDGAAGLSACLRFAGSRPGWATFFAPPRPRQARRAAPSLAASQSGGRTTVTRILASSRLAQGTRELPSERRTRAMASGNRATRGIAGGATRASVDEPLALDDRPWSRPALAREQLDEGNYAAVLLSTGERALGLHARARFRMPLVETSAQEVDGEMSHYCEFLFRHGFAVDAGEKALAAWLACPPGLVLPSRYHAASSDGECSAGVSPLGPKPDRLPLAGRGVVRDVGQLARPGLQ